MKMNEHQENRWFRVGRRVIVLVGMACAFLAGMGGCAKPAGVIFPVEADAPQWPTAPDEPRIRWVGQLSTDKDLKPKVSGLDAVGQAVFGEKPAHSMLTPFALCTDGTKDGRLFVADSNAQLVHVFNMTTRKYAMWKPGKKEPAMGQPVGVAWDSEAAGGGRLLVADSVAGVLFVFDGAGKYAGQLGAGVLQRPCGIAVEPGTRRIFVADAKAHQVVVLNATGEEVKRIGVRGTKAGEFNFPTTVTFGPTGDLFVCDTLNFRVQQFNAEGKVVRMYGKKGDMPGYFAQPKGIGVDGESHLYVLDSQFENVQLFDELGRVLMDFGEEGRGRGQFWLPTGMFVERGTGAEGMGARIWIADSYNRRVQVFDYLPAKPEVKP